MSEVYRKREDRVSIAVRRSAAKAMRKYAKMLKRKGKGQHVIDIATVAILQYIEKNK